MKHIAVLGATGSIGTSTLRVVESLTGPDGPEEFRDLKILGLTAHSRWEDLADQTHQHHPEIAVLSAPGIESAVDRSRFSPQTELRFGPDAIEELAADKRVDTVIAGIVGAAGLRGTWAAIEAGKRVGVANKETLVVAGPLVTGLAKKTGAELIPVDSEHSAIFQALRAGRHREVRRIVLTASGGPFRNLPAEEFASITPEDALRHPTWEMGPKITIDSATMMNKALEIIEARWLFDLDASQIEVVIHPQSIIHSFVEFVDGSVIAQLSPPDMMLPIQYAITYPERTPGPSPAMNWSEAVSLDLSPPDPERFPALTLGFEVAAKGGTCGTVLNAANETAVAKFLDGSLPFCGISQLCRDLLDSHDYDPNPTLSQLLQLDRTTRQRATLWNG